MSITEGKWQVLSDGITIKAQIEYKPHFDAVPPQTFIAKCFQNGHLGRTQIPTDEDKANAHLIAAAPDLLKACKVAFVLLCIAQTNHQDSCTKGEQCPMLLAIKKCEAAIAAAKGKEIEDGQRAD